MGAVHMKKPTARQHDRACSGVPDASMAEQSAYAGKMLESCYTFGDRDLALIWQRAMFDIVKLRRARRFGSDIQREAERME